MNPEEIFTLTVNGQQNERWEEIRVTREIDRMAMDFNIAVSECFLASAPPRTGRRIWAVTLLVFQRNSATGY